MFAMVKAFVPRYLLRPADAARLEGVPAAVAGDGVVLVAGVLQFTGWPPGP
jgi:hypothetical protein